MKEIRKQEEMDKKLREMGQPEPDPDNAAVVIQKLFRGFKTLKQARMMREEELVNVCVCVCVGGLCLCVCCVCALRCVCL